MRKTGIHTLFTFLFLLIFSLQAFSSGYDMQEEDSVGVNLTTPFHSARTFFLNLREGSYYPELAAQAFHNRMLSDEKARAVVVKLKQVMEVKGLEPDFDAIPNRENYRDTTRKLHQQRYVLVEEMPMIYLEKTGRKWLFPESTAKRVEVLYQEAFPFGTDKLMMKLNQGLKGMRGGYSTSFFGLYIWQWIGILLIMSIGFVLYIITRYIVGSRLSNWLYNKGFKVIATEYVMPVMKPLSFLLALTVLKIGFRLVELPFLTYKYILTSLQIAIPLVSAVILFNLANVVAGLLKRFANQTENTMDDQLVPMVRKGLKALILIISAVWLLSNLNVDVIPLLTGLSIGGLAFALAAQDTLKNIFGSMMIIVDKPFHIGDWITIGSEIDGMVEEVGFRSTRVRTFRDSLISVPNGKLADMVIDNNGRRQYRRFYTTLSVRYDTPPEVIDLFVQGLRKIVMKHPKTWKDFHQIHLNDFGASSLDIMFYIFFEVPDWEEELKARHEVMLQALRLAEVLGIHFAFPTQTLHMENFPGRNSLQASYNKDTKGMKQKMHDYVNQINGASSNKNGHSE